MNFPAIIAQKKLGGALSDEQIAAFVKGAADGSVPDYQLAALLMAIRLNGMDARETTTLTLEMAKSGDMLHPDVGGVPVDKHSTGGVGDTTTLVLVPLCAACGAKIAKMSGRGLGHTGGTVDKMESIGMRTSLPEAEFLQQIRQIGCAVVGQSAELAPADKTLYALRDTPATVDSLPLIASSIMSKKLAAGAKNIVLDVKAGSGAFMKTAADARLLAEKMTALGRRFGRNVSAVISNMDRPLGNTVGNALELEEAVGVLRGEVQGDIRELSLRLAAELVSMADGVSPEAAAEKAARALDSGAALAQLRRWITAQGGDPNALEDPMARFADETAIEVKSPRAGYLVHMDTERIGLVSMALGAGRRTAADAIDPGAGLRIFKKTGDRVEAGERLAVLYTKNASGDEAARAYLAALTFGDTPPVCPPLIEAVVR